jgi:hypothetical protein
METAAVLPQQVRDAAGRVAHRFMEEVAGFPISDWTKESWAESLVVNWAYAVSSRNSYVGKQESELQELAKGAGLCAVDGSFDRGEYRSDPSNNTGPHDKIAFAMQKVETGEHEAHFAWCLFSAGYSAFTQLFGKNPNLNRRTETSAKGPSLANAALQWGRR